MKIELGHTELVYVLKMYSDYRRLSVSDLSIALMTVVVPNSGYKSCVSNSVGQQQY